jgi:hypothetical protein
MLARNGARLLHYAIDRDNRNIGSIAAGRLLTDLRTAEEADE